MDQTPLAEILRPKTLEAFIGQSSVIGPNGPLYKALKNNEIYSMVFWGPPGTGKTTLARLLAKELDAGFFEVSPVTSGVKDIKAIIEGLSKDTLFKKNRNILFVDEIHRFNKAQQDYLLPHVEKGSIILIGATTENPSFEIVTPLLSRCKVYVFERFTEEELLKIIDNVVKYFAGQGFEIKISEEVKKNLINYSNGDARNLINTLDAARKIGVKELTKAELENILQKTFNDYDKDGEEHYNTISAFIKSMRASDADAALYYLARMVAGGEKPEFIARRMIIFASEDIGLADPNALSLAVAAFDACRVIGYPECQINLSHVAVYLAKAPKNRSTYDAFFEALHDAKTLGNLPVPMNLRNAPTSLMKGIGYGKGYEMYPKEGSYLPDSINKKKYLK